MDKDKQIQKVSKLSLEKLSEDSKLIKRGLRDLSIWPKIEDVFNKLKEKYQADEIDECIKLCLEILETNPNHFLTLSYYGCCLKRKGEYDKAISTFNRALEIDPNYYVVYYSRGVSYHYKGEYNKAIFDYSKALEIETNDPDIYNNRGAAYYQKGEYDKAISDYSKALEIDSNYNYFFLWKFRGDSYYKMGEYEKALEDYKKSFALDSTNGAALDDMAQCSFLLGDFKGAYDYIDQAIQVENESDMPMIRKAQFFEYQKRISEAVEQYKKTLNKFPNSEYAKKKIVELSNN